MYMGFMKNGLTLMIFFFLSFVPIVFFSSFEFLMALGLVIWFFGFFHARNYASMTDTEFDAMEDRYIWEEFPELGNIRIANTTVKKVIAAILIILGCGQLWRYFSGIIYNLIPQNIWNDIYPVVEGIPSVAVALLFITVGVLMVRGKKRELDIAPTVEIQRISEITTKQEEKPEVVADSETKEA
jgi:hypothetical protein